MIVMSAGVDMTFIDLGEYENVYEKGTALAAKTLRTHTVGPTSMSRV